MSQSQEPAIGVAAVLASPQPRTALSQFQLLNRVALVTGGRRGLGLEAALVLSEAGAIVYCLDLAAEPDENWLKIQSHVAGLPDLTDAAGLVKGKGRMEYLQGNIADQAAMWALAAQIADKEGRLDICVANAGILGSADALEYPADEFKKMLEVNVAGAFFSVQAVARQMERLKTRGSIIMLASMGGDVALRDVPSIAYNASKAAVMQLVRSFAAELSPNGIRINSISPGYIKTKLSLDFIDVEPQLEHKWGGQNPMGRIGRPEELRGLFLWLASDASSFCNGSDYAVDGGHRAF